MSFMAFGMIVSTIPLRDASQEIASERKKNETEYETTECSTEIVSEISIWTKIEDKFWSCGHLLETSKKNHLCTSGERVRCLERRGDRDRERDRLLERVLKQKSIEKVIDHFEIQKNLCSVQSNSERLKIKRRLDFRQKRRAFRRDD